MKNDLPDLSAVLGAPKLTGSAPAAAETAPAPAKQKLTRGGPAKAAKAPAAPKEPAAPAAVAKVHKPGVLTEAEIDLIEAEAEKEVAAEIHAKAMAEHKATVKARIKKKALFKPASGDEEEEGGITVRLDMAPHVPHVILDGVIYHPGYVYTVSVPVAKVLREQMYRSFLHDAEINGIDINAYLGRQHALKQISPSNPAGA